MVVSEIIGIVQIVIAVGAIWLAFKAYQKVLEQIKIASEQNKEMIRQREYDLRLLFFNTTKSILIEIDELEMAAETGYIFLEENRSKLNSIDAKYISDLEKSMKDMREGVTKQRLGVTEMSSGGLNNGNLAVIEEYIPKLMDSLAKVHTTRSNLRTEIYELKRKIQ